MINIRRNVFETNSSSTHSISIFTDEDWNKVVRGEGYISRYTNGAKTVFTKEEVCQKIVEFRNRWGNDEYNITVEKLMNMDAIEFIDYLEDAEYCKSDYECDNLEYEYTEYTTKSGETIHIVCEYGHD